MTGSAFRVSESFNWNVGRAGWMDVPRDRWRGDVPDVVGEAACCPLGRSAPIGLNASCPPQRRRGNDGVSSARDQDPTGNVLLMNHPPVREGGGGGGGFEGNRDPGGRGGRDGQRGERCSLCQFRNHSNPLERLAGEDDHNEGEGGGSGGGGGGGGRREAWSGGMAGEWRRIVPPSAADSNRRVPPAADERRARGANNRPDIAPDSNRSGGASAAGGRSSLPGNRVVVGPSHGRPLPDILNSHRVPPSYDQITAAAGQPPDSPQPTVRGYHGVTGSSGPLPVRPLSVIAHFNGGGGADRKGCCHCCCSRQFCIRWFVAMTTFRWLLVSFGVLGVGCIAAGVVLCILQMMSSGSYLFHSIVFMGLGVFLLVVIVVGWRCTPTGREPCHLFFNLADDGITSVTRTRSLHRRHRCRNDPHQWFGGVLYPEFRNRCPPPTYNASAQDYQHHLLMAQIQLAAATVHNTEYIGLPTSPPPTYRSRAATLQRPPAGTAPLHHQQQQPPPVDPLPMMAAPSSSNRSVVRSPPPPPTAAVQPPPGYNNNNNNNNNNTLPSTTVRTGSETNNGAAAASETEAKCGRCSGNSGGGGVPEVACLSGSNTADAGGQQPPKIGGGCWTMNGGGEGNSVTTGETTGNRTSGCHSDSVAFDTTL